jgi:uncharacterized membrane protein
MPGDPVVSVHVKLTPKEFYWAAVRSTTQQLRKVFVLTGFVGVLVLSGIVFATILSRSFTEWQQTIRGMYLLLFALVVIFPILILFVAPLFSTLASCFLFQKQGPGPCRRSEFRQGSETRHCSFGTLLHSPCT